VKPDREKAPASLSSRKIDKVHFLSFLHFLHRWQKGQKRRRNRRGKIRHGGLGSLKLESRPRKRLSTF